MIDVIIPRNGRGFMYYIHGCHFYNASHPPSVTHQKPIIFAPTNICTCARFCYDLNLRAIHARCAYVRARAFLFTITSHTRALRWIQALYALYSSTHALTNAMKRVGKPLEFPGGLTQLQVFDPLLYLIHIIEL